MRTLMLLALAATLCAADATGSGFPGRSGFMREVLPQLSRAAAHREAVEAQDRRDPA
jgi:hypothetical protein